MTPRGRSTFNFPAKTQRVTATTTIDFLIVVSFFSRSIARRTTKSHTKSNSILLLCIVGRSGVCCWAELVESKCAVRCVCDGWKCASSVERRLVWSLPGLLGWSFSWSCSSSLRLRCVWPSSFLLVTLLRALSLLLLVVLLLLLVWLPGVCCCDLTGLLRLLLAGDLLSPLLWCCCGRAPHREGDYAAVRWLRMVVQNLNCQLFFYSNATILLKIIKRIMLLEGQEVCVKFSSPVFS